MDDKMFEFMTNMYSDLTTRLDTIDKNLVKIESTLDTNSKALFDGYKQVYEKLENVEKQVNEVSSKVEKQDVEIKVIKGGKSTAI